MNFQYAAQFHSCNLLFNYLTFINREVPLSEDFVSAHILTEEEGGYFSSRWASVSPSFFLSNVLFSDGEVSVESCPGSSGWPETLKLLEGPGYQPSYAK